MIITRFRTCAWLAFLLAALCFTNNSNAALATVWHIPDNNTDLGIYMRNPEFEIATNTSVTVYTGVWKYNSGVQIANQTGGTLYYKGASQSTWTTAALSFYSNTTANQYWKATLNPSGIGVDDVIQYFFLLTFDGFNSVSNTYLYGGDSGSSSTGTSNAAVASPFTIRNRPAWLFHAGNRLVTPNANTNTSTVSFQVKVGYQGKDGTVASRYANQARLYYTMDGTTPSGALGIGSNTTQVAVMAYDHEEDDASVAGNGMWWKGSLTNVASYTTVNYKIGVWNSANNEEKFADYNSETNNTVFSFAIGTLGDPVLTVNGLNADYTTTHVFVDELAGDSIPLTIYFTPNASNVVEADVFSNLNRRNRATGDANGDGIEDGIVQPDGNLITTGNDSNYYKAYAMSNSVTPGQYVLTLNATNTGAYRLTARYKVSGNTNWFWYSSNGRRDHAIVATPTKARNITLYELNAMTVNSQGKQDYQRSTFTDLYNGPGSRPYDAVTNRVNLTYLQNLGVNWLWFQPIHPIGVLNRQTNSSTGQPFAVGSPYSVKNFFQINPLMGKSNTRDEAMQEFTNFVAAADAAGISVMLDEPFNHSAWDCELDASGVYYFASNAQPTDVISSKEARFYSRASEYDQRASGAGNIAQAPDRNDFGKWSDVADIYFGRYAALVGNSSQTGNYNNEGDWFDYTVGSESSTGTGNGHFDNVTQNVWRYFSDCVLYWLDKTGCPAGTSANQTYRGIDGLRADFGQGLPPQCWEYIINKVRSRKWDFVFMTESLDGGSVTYRSNRHFDILNENMIFSLASATTSSDYRSAFDARRTAYGQSLVLLNNLSHDEQAAADPYQSLIEFMACSTIDGAPMIFYGQELGISTSFGFDQYQVNFGKTIPLFMDYNSLQPLFAPANRTYGLDQLWPVYAAVNQARQFSPALRSANRYYLNQTGSGSPQASIFSVAKYATANASPNLSDVVLAFTTLDRNNTQTGNFNLNITQNGANLFGIKSNRLYNVKNIAAYTAIDGNRRNNWLWGGGVTGSNILANGVFVSLNPVPSSNGGWSGTPFEAQYLKLYDITPPPMTSAPGPTNQFLYTNVIVFTWPAVTDVDGGISGYHLLIGTASGGSNVFNGIVTGTSYTVTNIYGTRLFATVSAVNNAGIESGTAANSAGVALVNPAWIPVAAINGGSTLSWNSVSNKVYQVWYTTNLAQPFAPLSAPITATSTTSTYGLSTTGSAGFYKVMMTP